MAKIVTFGELMLRLQPYNYERFVQCDHVEFTFGGGEANVAVSLANYGLDAAYVTRLPAHAIGQAAVNSLRRYGVDTSCVKVNPGLTFHSVVLLNVSNSSRTCVWNRGEAAAPTVEDINLDALKQAKYLHLDGNQLDCAIFAAKKAHEMGVTVSMDAGGAYPNIEKLLPLVDVLIPSEEFSMKVTGCATAKEAAGVLQERYHPQILVITQGSKGGFIWENGREVRYPVFPVKAIDSNGAGDTFHGAFVAARLKGMDVYEACRFASATSALKCTRFGAQQGIPGYEEVLEFMKTHEGVVYDG